MSVKTLLQPHAQPLPAPPAPLARIVPQPIVMSSMAATIVDQPPMMHPNAIPRLVNPGDSVEQVRERMIQLGLDPNARMSIIPQPPPRRASEMLAATQTMAPQGRHATRLQGNAINRSR